MPLGREAVWARGGDQGVWVGSGSASVISLGEAFQELLAQLDRFEIRYLIGGSVASSSYGMPRQTNDIDILADFKGVDIHALCQMLSGEFYLDPEAVLSAVQTGRPFNVIHAKGIFKFD